MPRTSPSPRNPGSGQAPHSRCSLMQNSSPDDSKVLEDTEVRQSVWPR